MVNIKKEVDRLLFFLSKELEFNDITIGQGQYYLCRAEDVYNIYALDNLTTPVAFLFKDEMPKLMYNIFKRQTEDEQENVETTPYHIHKRPAMLRMVG